jgi:uncharacterized membrane protein YdfJ with MMPL/SSD domain
MQRATDTLDGFLKRHRRPLKLTGTREQSANLAVDLHKSIEPGKERDGVTPYIVGQEALWAGMQDVSKEHLASAERVGFPIVFVILLIVFGSFAAALLPLAASFEAPEPVSAPSQR